jgi:adenylate cyclase
VTLGWLHHERGQYAQAQEHLARAMAINPNDADTMMNRAMVLSLEGEAKTALELAQFAIRLNPRHPDWYIAYLGGCFFRADRYAEATAIWERAPDAVPEARAVLAAAYVLAGRPEEGRRHMQKFLKRFSLHWTGRPSVRSFTMKVFSYREQAELERFVDALRAAGMPE